MTNPNWKPEYEPCSANVGCICHLLENGLIVQKSDNDKWHIRRYSPNEVMDSKWDVWLRKQQAWGAAACLCFADLDDQGFNTAEEALIFAQSTDWDAVNKALIAKYATKHTSVSDVDDDDGDIVALVESDSFKEEMKELGSRVAAENAEWMDKGYTHTAWVSGLGGDRVYIKETPQGWNSQHGVTYRKDSGVATIVAEMTPLYQLNIFSIEKLKK